MTFGKHGEITTGLRNERKRLSLDATSADRENVTMGFIENDRHSLLARRINEINFVPTAFRVSLQIATLRIDVLSCSNRILNWVTSYFSAYIASANDAPDAEIFITASSELQDAALWNDSDAEFHSYDGFVAQRDFVARVDESGRVLALIGSVHDDAIFNLFRWLCPPLLLKRNAFLLHGAAVVRDQRAYVFFGQSGAGKTTTTTLISSIDEQAIVLGDDSVIVQLLTDGTPIAHAAPFGSSYLKVPPPNVTTPIDALFALEQSDFHRIEKLSPAAGMAALLASAMSIRFTDEVDTRFELACRFSKSHAAIHKLYFQKDPMFWNMILSRKNYETKENERIQNQSQI